MAFRARIAASFYLRWLYCTLVAFALLAPAQAGADGRHRHLDRVVVFGDSLSDPGNAFALNGGQTVSAPTYGMDGRLPNGLPEVITLVPDAPYASNHFSNGPTWIELLGAAAGFSASVKPAVAGALIGPDGGKAANYAVGGARASGAGAFDLGGQVGLFLSDARNRAPADALYVIAIGGNDIRAALAAPDPTLVIGAAVAAVGQNVERLYRAGARKFLLWNVPNLGRTPAIQRLDPFACPPAGQGCLVNAATALSAGYNLSFSAVLQRLGGLPGIEIVPFDTFGSLEAIATNPGRFGLRDATTACIQPNVPQFGSPSVSPFRCAQPDRHFFWDGIHPTRAGHAIIAFLVGKALVAYAFEDD
jgi:outer membrane lipase/esterase